MCLSRIGAIDRLIEDKECKEMLKYLSKNSASGNLGISYMLIKAGSSKPEAF
ncbi:19820_t:CDS:2 [Gigaspora margarita]|uniref:19820_t:CDS:1 n=1 Tax=Gigaspora margarita TaxID=4874 RepID=A0ABN7UFV0_GIGMA|nr:19820_t:CDS:2 [Gigaspora margarita]